MHDLLGYIDHSLIKLSFTVDVVSDYDRIADIFFNAIRRCKDNVWSYQRPSAIMGPIGLHSRHEGILMGISIAPVKDSSNTVDTEQQKQKTSSIHVVHDAEYDIFQSENWVELFLEGGSKK